MLFREKYPALLRRGDRGKYHDITQAPLQYGGQRVAEGVDGIELLEAYERGDIYINSDGIKYHISFYVDDIRTSFLSLCIRRGGMGP